MKVQIPVAPIAWPRPTFMNWTRNGKQCRAVINPKKALSTKLRKDAFEKLKTACPPHHTVLHSKLDSEQPLFPHPTAVRVDCEFYRPLPLRCFKANQRSRGLRDGVHGSVIPDASTPDLDNLTKFVLDAPQQVVCHDDRQVVSIYANKCLDARAPHTGRVSLSFLPIVADDDESENYNHLLSRRPV